MAWLDYVNVRQGTDSTFEFSTGNTLPLVAVPFGMNHWCPQTELRDKVRFFSPRSRVFHGLRLTHQPSPWIGDYAAMLLLPQTGEALPGREARHAVFRPERMILRPDCFEVELLRYRTVMRMAPSCRGAVVVCEFPADEPKRLILDFFGPRFEVAADADGRGVSGWTALHSGGVPDGFRCWFRLEFDCGVTALSPAPDGCCCELPRQATTVTVRLATSFIGAGQAALNLERETAGHGFAALRDAAARQWEDLLARIAVAAPETQQRTFYSCLYRVCLFPRVFHEYDRSGAQVHYSPYDGGVHPGPMYADNGFWDTHRTVYPLFTLLFPDRCAEMLQGWTNAAAEGGFFPRWSSPGYRSCMIGTHADAVIADAAVRGITGFDLESAYRAMLRDAFEPGHPEGWYGRRGLDEYLRLGYVPVESCEHAASRTLDYAANDFCIAQVARLLGDGKNHADLLRRGGNYRHIFNPATGWLQGRHRDGSWRTPFDPLEWGGDYIEGSAWQCGWAVPHDPDGLIRLYGGPRRFQERVETMLAMPPYFRVGAYRAEIHEMTEMAAADFGQYAHSNQPVHHVLWLYAHSGAGERAEGLIRRVATEMYSPEVFPGDEDNGEMAAWYVFATLGLYPLTPGRAEYLRIAPLASEVVLTTVEGPVCLPVVPARDGRPDYVGHDDLCRGCLPV